MHDWESTKAGAGEGSSWPLGAVSTSPGTAIAGVTTAMVMEGEGAGQRGGQAGAPEQGQQGMAGVALTLPAWKGRKRSRKARLASRRCRIRSPAYTRAMECPTGSDRRAFRRRSALPMTETLERLMATLASMGLMSHPKAGYRSPAAMGTPKAL